MVGVGGVRAGVEEARLDMCMRVRAFVVDGWGVVGVMVPQGTCSSLDTN